MLLHVNAYEDAHPHPILRHLRDNTVVKGALVTLSLVGLLLEHFLKSLVVGRLEVVGSFSTTGNHVPVLFGRELRSGRG